MCGNNSRGFQRVEQRKLKSFRNETGRSNLHNCHSNVSPVKIKGLEQRKTLAFQKQHKTWVTLQWRNVTLLFWGKSEMRWIWWWRTRRKHATTCSSIKPKECVQPANASSSQRWSQWDRIKRHSFSLSNRLISIFSIRF